MNQQPWDALWVNCRLVPCETGSEVIEDAAIAITGKQIAWLGRQHDLSDDAANLAKHVYDVEHCLVTPGLIDCHSHLIYGGNRANEFEMRLHGKTYAEIAASGGGIQSTVKATREASEQDLFEQAFKRAVTLMMGGVTTLEIKSGYGLDLETELKMLRVAKRIESVLPMTIYKTFLGAHTIPAEYKADPERYVNVVCNEMIPMVASQQLADAVDVFCETIAFNLSQTQRVFDAAKKHQLAIKCHAEQLSDSGATSLAASYRALSVDHLEHVSENGIKAIAESGTVAVLLPGAYYFLRETTMPPIDLLRQYQVPMAIATDANPGTSPVLSLLLMMNMACTLWRMTPTEALLGVTRHAAKALGCESIRGTLTIGKQADFALWDVTEPSELAYMIGANPLRQLVRAGVALVE